ILRIMNRSMDILQHSKSFYKLTRKVCGTFARHKIIYSYKIIRHDAQDFLAALKHRAIDIISCPGF
ncbi:MAG TPA: hypothetical protein VIU13_08725, partial [Chryseolinea sp.]